MYGKQIDNGKYFLHEHPRDATSWGMPEVRKVLARPGVRLVAADMCQFNLTIKDSKGEGLAKKPTLFMTNSRELARELGKKCQGGHQHKHIEGGRVSRASGIYTEQLCAAICTAAARQLAADQQPGGDRVLDEVYYNMKRNLEHYDVSAEMKVQVTRPAGRCTKQSPGPRWNRGDYPLRTTIVLRGGEWEIAGENEHYDGQVNKQESLGPCEVIITAFHTEPMVAPRSLG